MGHGSGGHAKPGVAVHVGLQEVAHHMAEDGELLQRQVPGADSGHALRAVFVLEGAQPVRHIAEALVPAQFPEAAVALSELGQRRGLHRGLLLAQRQALDAAEAVVDRVARRRDGLDDLPVLHIEVQIAVDRAEIAGGLYLLHRIPPGFGSALLGQTLPGSRSKHCFSQRRRNIDIKITYSVGKSNSFLGNVIRWREWNFASYNIMSPPGGRGHNVIVAHAAAP